jgi:FkbM family methyltransferase
MKVAVARRGEISLRVLNALSLGIVGFVVLAAAFFYYSPFRILTLVASGRNYGCPRDLAFEADRNAKALLSAKAKFETVSAVVRQEGADELWRTPKGEYWFPKGESLAFHLAEQERKIYGEGDTGVHPGDVVLDAGAHVGVYTREALAAGATKVIAIEPAPENLALLRRNLEAEIAAGRVIVYDKGVWDREETLTFHRNAENTAADSFVGSSEKGDNIQLPVTTIDKIVAELKLEKVDFIKMDIEGSERRALRGARETITKYRPRMAICVYHMKDDPVEIPAVIGQIRQDYRLSYGPTGQDHYFRIIPQTVLFH